MTPRAASDPPSLDEKRLQKRLEKASGEVVAMVLRGAADVFDDPDLRYQPMTGAAVAIALRKMADNAATTTERSTPA